MPALWELCKDGKLAEVRAALAGGHWGFGGANVNNKDSDGKTALMWAVIRRHDTIVKLLLDRTEVKVNEKNKWGQTALHYAAYRNNPEGARLLLLHPGFNSANATDMFGSTALMEAVRYRNKEVLVELVRHDSVGLEIPDGVFDGR